VSYFGGDGGPVPGTSLSLDGTSFAGQNVSDAAGEYTIADVPVGVYTLTAQKHDDVAAITAFDASLAMQAYVQSLVLSPHQIIAADVTRNGTVSPLDAAYILEKSVGSLEVPFPGADRVWHFAPQTRHYELIGGHLTDENFTAILLGDVSGNWQPPAPAPSQAADTATAVAESTLALPALNATSGQFVQMPLTIALAADDVFSADLVLRYDAGRLSPVDVTRGEAAGSASLTSNTDQPGVIRVGLAAGQPLTAEGTLLNVTFEVVGPLHVPADVLLESASLNEGQVAVAVEHGSVRQAPDAAAVLGRCVFYNNSAFDGFDSAAGADDDPAVATDKRALLPGQIATFANYSSYSRGINGIMIDVAGLPDGFTPGVDDFRLAVGNDADPAAWQPAPAPSSVTLREGAGQAGADRITLVWPDYAIANQWLEVTLRADGFSLTADDVFYFGSAVAEAGNFPADAKVTTTDMLLARNNPRSLLNPAAIDFPYDTNRDRRVDATDVLLARNNQTSFLTALELIDLSGPTGGSVSAGIAAESNDASGERLTSNRRLDLAWLGDYASGDWTSRRTEKTDATTDATTDAVDKLLATSGV